MVQKGYILAEIVRTARENGGIPLGRKRFTAVTGIKEGEWYGCHWVRWSDAIAEAGLAPNSFQKAYDEGFLLGKLALLVRELNHMPVRAEIQLKSRTDKDFPSVNTFERFGGKKGLVTRLVQFCDSHPELQDVATICRPLCTDASEANDRTKKNVDFGDVYLLKCGRSYKIGHSNASGRRERELAIQLPEKSKIVHVIKTDDPCGIERYWHQRFDSKRKNGEWFELSAEDVSAFRRRKFM
jgi:hypothetical protein